MSLENYYEPREHIKIAHNKILNPNKIMAGMLAVERYTGNIFLVPKVLAYNPDNQKGKSAYTPAMAVVPTGQDTFINVKDLIPLHISDLFQE